MKWTKVLAAIAIIISLVAASVGIAALLSKDGGGLSAQANVPIYIEQGGARLVVGAGGELEVQSGGVIDSQIGAENVGSLPTIASAAVTYQSSGALWTVADGEIWIVHQVLLNVTANFDCTGSDCTLQIGDGTDPNGLLDLVDAEMQAAAVEVTGGAAGWHGYLSGTLGAYLADSGGFVYAPSGSDETIDIAIGGTDPAAGVGTAYIIYTRLQ